MVQNKQIPRRRHWRRIPPDDMFFSASISVKLRELAKMRTSTRLMRRCRKVMEASTVKPCEGSMFSSSCWQRKIQTIIRMCMFGLRHHVFIFLSARLKSYPGNRLKGPQTTARSKTNTRKSSRTPVRCDGTHRGRGGSREQG